MDEARAIQKAGIDAVEPGERDPSDSTVPIPRARWLKRSFWGAIKWTVSATLAQSVLGAIFLLGWSQRLTSHAAENALRRRGVIRSGDRQAPEQRGESDRRFRSWPNWLLASEWREEWRRSRGLDLRTRAAALTGSLWENARLGAQSLLNVGVLTLPCFAIMFFAWYAGWNNSFHKGYEQAVFGPLTSLFGIALFIGVMFYVPMAWARQACTRRAKAFWQGGIVWPLIRASRPRAVAFAALVVLLNLPLTALKAWPYFVPQARLSAIEASDEIVADDSARKAVDWDDLTPRQAREHLNRHYWISGFYLFGALVVLRVASGRIYAGALRGIAQNRPRLDDLDPRERELLQLASVAMSAPAGKRNFLSRFTRWLATKAGGMLCGFLVGSLWFTFIAQLYVSEFLRYTSWQGWLNHPLLMLPWFRHMPSSLENQGGEVLMTGILILLATWLARAVNRRSVGRRRTARP